MKIKCKTCKDEINITSQNSYIKCEDCRSYIHFECAKLTYLFDGSFMGDLEEHPMCNKCYEKNIKMQNKDPNFSLLIRVYKHGFTNGTHYSKLLHG